MSDLEELRERLRNHRPVPWDQLPDFALYMDQILNYMDRQVIRFQDDDALTAAMVNNYTKSGLVPRAEGKKYGREHLAYLTAICILKRVMSTRDMDLLIRQELHGSRSVADGYAAFCASLDKALRITLREVEQREGVAVPAAAGDGTPAGQTPENGEPPESGAARENGETPESGAARGNGETPESGAAREDGETPESGAAREDGETPESSASREDGKTPLNGAVANGTERPETAESAALPSQAARHSLADNAIHFALLSYAAGIASRRYVILLRRQYVRAGETPPSGKTAKREAKASDKTARREAKDKTAKREAKASDKTARREAKDKTAKREAKASGKTARREAKDRTAKREAKASDKTARREATSAGKAGE